MVNRLATYDADAPLGGIFDGLEDLGDSIVSAATHPLRTLDRAARAVLPDVVVDWVEKLDDRAWDVIKRRAPDVLLDPTNWAVIGGALAACLGTAAVGCGPALVVAGKAVALREAGRLAKKEVRAGLDKLQDLGHIANALDAPMRATADALIAAARRDPRYLALAAAHDAEQRRRSANDRAVALLRGAHLPDDFGPEEAWFYEATTAMQNALLAGSPAPVALAIGRGTLDARYQRRAHDEAVAALRALRLTDWGPEEAWFYAATEVYANRRAVGRAAPAAALHDAVEDLAVRALRAQNVRDWGPEEIGFYRAKDAYRSAILGGSGQPAALRAAMAQAPHGAASRAMPQPAGYQSDRPGAAAVAQALTPPAQSSGSGMLVVGLAAAGLALVVSRR